MAQFTQHFISGNFATGVIHYDDHYPGQEHSARIVLPVVVKGRLTVQAVVDTGAPWCVFDPDILQQLDALDEASYTPDENLTVKIRGTSYKGQLLRIQLGLAADEGDSLDVDATVFVPDLPISEVWSLPNFIGLDGFLNRIRFAVDPDENTFYFGCI